MTALLSDAGPLAPGRLRLLGGGSSPDLRPHLDRHGPLRLRGGRDLIAEVEAAGLRGRGGAAFPTHIKLQAVARSAARRGSPVVVANGTEGEPASAKDKILLRRSPHLVLDGMVAAAVAVGADRGVICVDRRDAGTLSAVGRALAERRRRDPLAISLAETPSRYVSGEETALVNWLGGGAARPTFSPPRPSESGVGGAPTLVDNVETLAHLALVARYGAAAFRLVGDPDEPGTMLVTARGEVPAPGVYEVPTGTPLESVTGAGDHGAVLVGGYFGSWLTGVQVSGAQLSSAGLRPLGASPGCGVVAVLPEGHCPLQEVSCVLDWLAANSAGQCGACFNGLPALAGAFRGLVAGDPRAEAVLDRWAPMVSGRGACKLPDGAVRFLHSARRSLAGHIACHRRCGPCRPNRTRILPTPSLDGWR